MKYYSVGLDFQDRLGAKGWKDFINFPKVGDTFFHKFEEYSDDIKCQVVRIGYSELHQSHFVVCIEVDKS